MSNGEFTAAVAAWHESAGRAFAPPQPYREFRWKLLPLWEEVNAFGGWRNVSNRWSLLSLLERVSGIARYTVFRKERR